MSAQGYKYINMFVYLFIDLQSEVLHRPLVDALQIILLRYIHMYIRSFYQQQNCSSIALTIVLNVLPVDLGTLSSHRGETSE